MPQPYNAQLVEELATTFPRRTEPNYAWGNAVGGYLLLPRLRAFWPPSSIDVNSALLDFSHNSFNLGAVGGASVNINGAAYPGIVPYLELANWAGMYFSRNDDALSSITDFLTVTCWVRFTPAVIGSGTPCGLISKWLGSPNDSYLLYKQTDDLIYWVISSTGLDVIQISSSPLTMLADRWYFIAANYYPSSYIKLYVGDSKTGVLSTYQNVVGIPAGIFDSTAIFTVGSAGGGTFMSGLMSLIAVLNYPFQYLGIWNLFQQTRPLFLG